MKLESRYLRIVLVIALALLLGFFIGFPNSNRSSTYGADSAPGGNSNPRLAEHFNSTPYIDFNIGGSYSRSARPVYLLSKVVFKDEFGSTADPESITQATLVFQCSEFQGCEDLLEENFVARVKLSGQNFSDNLALNNEVESQPARTEVVESGSELDSEFDSLVGIENEVNINETISITVSIDQIIDEDNPGGIVEIFTEDSSDSSAGSVSGGTTENTDENNPGCSKSSDCPSGQICTWASQCRDGECSHDLPCPDGEFCELYTCGECKKKINCPDRQYCDSGTCRDGDCGNARDCGCGEECVNNQCKSTDDNGKSYCNFFKRRGECSNDCPEGEVCKANSYCEDPNSCRYDYQCPSGKCCDDNGSCTIDCECHGNLGCPDDSYCDQRTCKKGCWADDQCKHCTICNKTTHECEAIEEAGVKADCPPACDTVGAQGCQDSFGNVGECCEDNICRPDCDEYSDYEDGEYEG